MSVAAPATGFVLRDDGGAEGSSGAEAGRRVVKLPRGGRSTEGGLLPEGGLS